MAFLLQHFTLRLLEANIIDQRIDASLYEEALGCREKIAEAMFAIGKELIVDTDRGVMGIRNFNEDTCDRMTEEAGTPPLPVFQRATLSFTESAILATIFLHYSNSQSMTEEAAWISEENMVELLMGLYTEKLQRNEISVGKDIRRTLQKLNTLGLIEKREADGMTFWRASRYLPFVMTNDQVREMERTLQALEARKDAGIEATAEDDADQTADLFNMQEEETV